MRKTLFKMIEENDDIEEDELINYDNYLFFKERLQNELDKIKIKNGFLYGSNMGWRNLTGITKIFSVNFDELMNNLRINGDFNIVVWKEGNRLGFTRYSHDEPTGADIWLYSLKHYKKIKDSINEN